MEQMSFDNIFEQLNNLNNKTDEVMVIDDPNLELLFQDYEVEEPINNDGVNELLSIFGMNSSTSLSKVTIAESVSVGELIIDDPALEIEVNASPSNLETSNIDVIESHHTDFELEKIQENQHEVEMKEDIEIPVYISEYNEDNSNDISLESEVVLPDDTKILEVKSEIVQESGQSSDLPVLVFDDSVEVDNAVDTEVEVIPSDAIEIVENTFPKIIQFPGTQSVKSETIKKKTVSYKGYNATAENLSRTPITRFEDNINALKKLAELEKSDKKMTKADAEILAKYSGWGALGDFFKEEDPRNEVLRALLGDGYAAAEYSVTSAYYTPVSVIRFMYGALKRFGFEKGKILECSVGSGRYFSFMNKSIYEKSKLYGVELDEVSSKITSYLHPKATIINSGFEKTEFDDEEFDVCISNIPFGDLAVYDTQDKDLNKYGFKIHDYFFAKALRKVRTGGIVAFVTSAGFMDKKDSSVREYLSKNADLLGVVRLPNTTFIGTNVVADIVFLRKVSEPKNTQWVEATDLVYDSKKNNFEHVEFLREVPSDMPKFSVNKFISLRRNSLVAGSLKVTSTQFGEGLTVSGPPVDEDDFKKYLKLLPSNVYVPRGDDSYLYEEDEVIKESEILSLHAYNSHPWIKDLREDEYVCIDDVLYRKQSNKLLKEKCSDKRYQFLKSYALVKGAIMDIRTNPDATDSELSVAQSRLNAYYEDFVSKYGNAADPAHRRILGSDHVGYPLFLALENVTEVYDSETDSIIPIYKKADIFTKRVVGKSYKVEDPKTLEEAIVLSFYLTGKLDLHLISERLNRDIESVIADCLEEGRIYYNIEECRYEDASEFLSGYVKDKLKYSLDLLNRIENANDIITVPIEKESFLSNIEDAKWHISHLNRNIAALKENQPEFIDNVEFEFSTTWIPVDVKEKFIFKTLEIKDVDMEDANRPMLVYDEKLGYEFRCRCHVNTVLMHTEWGTSRVKASRIVEHALNDTFPEVSDTFGGEKTVNVAETQMAMTMVKKWASAFKNYVLSNPDLHLELVQLYNDLFVRIKEKVQGNIILDAQTSPEITPRKHQLIGASRICTSRKNTLLYHTVGTGKSYTMHIASRMLYKMRMYKEGRPNKSMFVVPNSLSLSGQFAREYLTIYPDANILALTPKDFEGKNRRKILSKIATNNWEAVIIPYSVLNMIPMKKETLDRLYQQDIMDMEAAIRNYENEGRSLSVYRMQQMISKRKAAFEGLLDIHKDEFAIYFEDLGIDQLFVDEAHNFKALFFVTKKERIAGIDNHASKRASNLYNMVRYLNEKDPSNVVFATATPISNTVGELFNFSRYLDPEGLKKHGVYEFDAWSSTFGSIVNEVEADVTGQNFKVKPRFAKFFNIPELITMVKEFADVIFTEDVAEIEVPSLITGAPIDIEIEPTEEMKGYIDDLVERVKKFENSSGEQKKKDNMLKICGDGRKLALAPRLVGINQASPKVSAVINNVYKVYSEHPEGTQLIFCDLGTPDSAGGYSVYQEIKDGLIDKGISESEIAFIHDCGDSPTKREALIKKFNDGVVKVLMGSTLKMGEGVNLQKKVKALHHVDAPWLPASVQQREGRIIRHGNVNKEVFIFRYLVKNSFDVFSWQSATRS